MNTKEQINDYDNIPRAEGLPSLEVKRANACDDDHPGKTTTMLLSIQYEYDILSTVDCNCDGDSKIIERNPAASPCIGERQNRRMSLEDNISE